MVQGMDSMNHDNFMILPHVRLPENRRFGLVKSQNTINIYIYTSGV